MKYYKYYAGNCKLIWQIVNDIHKATDYEVFNDLIYFDNEKKTYNSELFLFFSNPF